jgi:cytochrome b subunit of formate dehydrogenase
MVVCSDSPRQHRVVHGLVLILSVLLCLTSLSPLLQAQENDECLMCHEDEDMTGFRGDKEISVYVDPELYGDSVHADMDCIDCHIDLSGIEMEHDEDVEPVDCAMCHDGEAEQHAISLHGRAAARGDAMAPTCADCHGNHHILPSSDIHSPTSRLNIPLLCGTCHREGAPVERDRDIPQDRILANYSMSIHGEGLFLKGLTVTAVCTSCHTAHEILSHNDPRSSIHHNNVAATCTVCHARIEEVHVKVIEGRLWEEEPHKIPACVDCHQPHEIRRSPLNPKRVANKECLHCHADPELSMERDGEQVSLFMDEEVFDLAMHAQVACAQCHTEVDSSSERPCSTISKPVDCAICHAEVVTWYESSTHGKLALEGDPEAPGCLSCHDQHATESHLLPTSSTYNHNVPELCGTCHAEGGNVAERVKAVAAEHMDESQAVCNECHEEGGLGSGPRTQMPQVTDIVGSYLRSTHGKGLIESGLVVSASCVDCHTTHRMLPPFDPESSVHPDNLTDTCGKCHAGISAQIKESIHWPENNDKGPVPTCEYCHTSHSICRTTKRGFRTMIMNRCGHCHEKEADTFFDTFHGKVSRLGEQAAAKCYDCHGSHNILPTSNPDSMLSFHNIVETCSQCHEGAHRQFAGYLTHATHHDPEKYPFLFWSFWGMTALLVGTLSFSLLHTLAWLYRLWRSRDEWKGVHDPAPGGKYYRRFTTGQRVNHLVMLISFFILSITGMTLKFSYTYWAQGVSTLLGGFENMGYFHRFGAIIMITIFVAHLFNVARRKKETGLSWFRFIIGPFSMLFNGTDLREFIGSIKWFLGMGPRPRYGRFTYWEKFDYFAVFWGVFIIGGTGLILWFPEFFTHFLPGRSVNVATVIHSDEALLATAFIFTIHFFNTHFRPDKFPMDPVIFTGRVPLEELKHDKPREYEQAVAEGTLESRLVEPYPEKVVKVIKILGFTALATGLTLILLIIAAMTIGYK